MSSLATTQAQILGFYLAHPNIYSLYELLVCVKRLVLQKESCKICTIQSNKKISDRSPGEDQYW